MKITAVWISFLACMLLPLNGYGQVGINATLSGTITDTSGALIPGAEVTATNEATGVVSTALSNESGIYRYPSLQPGNYDVKASLSGFQEKKIKLTLGTSAQIRQNFSLQVGGANTVVDVSVASDELLTASTASVNTVMAAQQIVGSASGRAQCNGSRDPDNARRSGRRPGQHDIRRHHHKRIGEYRNFNGWCDDEHRPSYAGPQDLVLRLSRHDR